MDNVCPYARTCPIFNGILKGKVFTTASYKKQYCEAGIEAWNTCRRYQCKQKFGRVPDDLLPNSTKTLDQIQKKYGW